VSTFLGGFIYFFNGKCSETHYLTWATLNELMEMCLYWLSFSFPNNYQRVKY